MKDDDLEAVNEIVGAATIYYTYFVPVHGDGRTVAEFLEIKTPSWLLDLVSAHREKELPFREARMVEKDFSHFANMLVIGIVQDITEEGGATDRSKVVAKIMEELRKDKWRREELNRLETDAYRRSRPSESSEEAAESVIGGEPYEEGKEEALPTVIIPFVTTYSVRKKDRVRALLQTYKQGRISVNFFGQEVAVELHKENEGDSNIFVVYCYPPSGSEGRMIGTRLGAVRLYRETLELSSTVEERHRALRDFAAKLVGPKEMHRESELRDAVEDPETGELVSGDELVFHDALADIGDKKPAQLEAEGLKACADAGMIARSGTDVPWRATPSLLTELLDDYRKSSPVRSGQLARAMRDSLVGTVIRRLSLGEEKRNVLYDGTVAIMALARVVIASANAEGEKQAARTLERIVDLKPVPDGALQPLLAYLESRSKQS
jgi:hypothetical protein